MSNYTPSANDVEFAYMDSTERILGTSPFAASDEFDRFTARVKAEAWDEGHSWGWSDAQEAHDVRQEMSREDWSLKTPNPYRQEGER